MSPRGAAIGIRRTWFARAAGSPARTSNRQTAADAAADAYGYGYAGYAVGMRPGVYGYGQSGYVRPPVYAPRAYAPAVRSYGYGYAGRGFAGGGYAARGPMIAARGGVGFGRR